MDIKRSDIISAEFTTASLPTVRVASKHRQADINIYININININLTVTILITITNLHHHLLFRHHKLHHRNHDMITVSE